MKKIFTGMILVMAWMHGLGDVILTGMVDGTLTGGKPKAIELFIAGTEDLGGYEIWRSQNGDPFGAGLGSIAALSGVYSNTFVYLVKPDHVAEFHSVFGDAGYYAHVIALAIVSGNGNEGFQIRDTVGDVVVDQLWLESPTDSYRDSYWYRMNGTGPDGTWLATNWGSPGNDALDGLDEAGLRAAVPFGTFAQVWRGLNDDWNDVANWMPAAVPSQDCNVYIADTVATFPVITSSPATPAECFLLEVADGASVTVAAGKALTVFGDLRISGTQTSERFILDSDSSLSPTGSLLLKGTTTDSITVRRFIPDDNSWHFLSSPVTGQPIRPEFAPDPLDNSFDLYCWQENMPQTDGWMNIRDGSGNLNPSFDTEFSQGKGYLLAYSGQYTGSLIKRFSGIPEHESVILIGLAASNHWNLMGNPYTCALDWSSPAITKSTFTGGAMYIWDQTLNSGAGAYRSHNGNAGVPAGTAPSIPAMNAFFVNISSFVTILLDKDNPTLLSHASQDYYKDAPSAEMEMIRLRISTAGYSDETLMIFSPDASNGFDMEKDALKLSNGVDGAPEISTLTEGDIQLCINQLGSYPVSVPLCIDYGYPDSLVLTAFDFDELDPAAGLFLEDVQAGIWQNLRENPEYAFRNQIPATPQRLILHITDFTGTARRPENRDIKAYVSGNCIHLSGNINGFMQYHLIDMEGRNVSSGMTSGSIELGEATHGMYILHLHDSRKSYRMKIIL